MTAISNDHFVDPIGQWTRIGDSVVFMVSDEMVVGRITGFDDRYVYLERTLQTLRKPTKWQRLRSQVMKLADEQVVLIEMLKV